MTKKSTDAIAARIEGPGLPAPVFSCGEVGSVLDMAREQELNPPVWGSVLARSQTAGRGQLRRHWHSPPGNVYAALRLPWEPPFSGMEAAPALGALLVAVLREKLAGTGADVRLKWPNDVVLLRGDTPYKIGGVLLEERGGRVVAGIGINHAWAPPEHDLRRDHAMPAAHLNGFVPAANGGARPGGEGISPAEAFWCQLVSGVYFWYTNELSPNCSWQSVAEAHLLWKGVPVLLSEGSGQVRGILQGLGPSGGVRLSVGGRVEDFLSGSLSAAAGTRLDVPEGQRHE